MGFLGHITKKNWAWYTKRCQSGCNVSLLNFSEPRLQENGWRERQEHGQDHDTNGSLDKVLQRIKMQMVNVAATRGN